MHRSRSRTRRLQLACGVFLLCLSFLLLLRTETLVVFRRDYEWMRVALQQGHGQQYCQCRASGDDWLMNSNSSQIPVNIQALKLPTSQRQCQHEPSTSYNHCLDMMMNTAVFVNAMSSNHFRESQQLIGSIQKMMPGSKIIIYDLGLEAAQIREIHKMCNVEFRRFHFDKYPPHVSGNNLMNYAWKPLIINEVSLEYEIVVWADTSIRFHASLKEHIFPYLLKSHLTFVALPLWWPEVNIVKYSHGGTIAYFNLTRAELAGLPQIQAGFGVYWITEPVRKMLDEWVDCAMHKNCIAPNGAKSIAPACIGKLVVPQHPNDTEYCGCHRFDQSALDLILYKHYGRGLYEVMKPVAWSTCTVERHGRGPSAYNYVVMKCS